MIKFKYVFNDNLLPLIRSEMIDFTDNFIVGYLDEGYSNQLSLCSLFLCCNYEYKDNQNMYRNPVGIVATNTQSAAIIYSNIFDGENCFIHSVLENDCKKMEVEPL